MTRVRRLSAVTELTLGPLDRDQTAEQLVMLGAPATTNDVDRIFRRSRGLPLFTDQLAAHIGDNDTLPGRLAEFLDHRLDGVDPATWAVARCLGAADRPVPEPVLGAVTGLGGEELRGGLYALDRLRQLAITERDIALRHPLLAEAVRRRLLPGEAADTHRLLALALAEAPDADPAEIAGHWQAADDPVQELSWRIRAAEAAVARFAFAQAAKQWLRALELWTDDVQRVAGLSRVDAGLAAVAAFLEATEVQQARALADVLADGSLSEDEAGQLLVRRSHIGNLLGHNDRALSMATEAVAIFETKSPSVALVRALTQVSFAHRNLGRHADAHAAVTRAVEICEAIGDTTEQRRLLVLGAWDRAELGDLDGALAAIDQALSLPVPEPDPITDVRLAGAQTDLLLRRGAPAQEIEEAGRRGLEVAERWDLAGSLSCVLRSNVAAALLRAGKVDRAAGFIDSVTDADPSQGSWATYGLRVELDAVRGRFDDALARLARLDRIRVTPLSNKIEHESGMAAAELWAARPEAALERLLGVLEEVTDTDVAYHAAECLTLVARAAADLAAADPRRRRPLLERLRRLWAQIGVEPGNGPASGHACAATGEAELARLGGTQSVEIWAHAATEWDRLTRPFDAAYCRWRAAQVALATGQATLAQRLLKRAATDARTHAPLRAGIRDTADGE